MVWVLVNRVSAPARAGSIAVALFCLALSPARAQDGIRVQGHVLHDLTGQPVEGAVVTVEGRSGGTVTDSTGAFEFDGLPSALLRFRIQRLGFWPTVVPVELSRSTSLLFRISANPIVAERIEVVIDVLEGRRNALPYAVRTFGPERIAPHLALDLETFLRRRAGLHLVPCRTSAFGGSVPGLPECLSGRGRTNPVRVWIDDSPAPGGLDFTIGYDMTEVHSIEVVSGCGMIRVYSWRFMNSVASGLRRLYPVLLDCAA